MTTEEAIDILIKRGSNNDREDEALEKLAFKAQAFDILKNRFDLRLVEIKKFGTISIDSMVCKCYLNVHDEPVKRIFRMAFKEDNQN